MRFLTPTLSGFEFLNDTQTKKDSESSSDSVKVIFESKKESNINLTA